MSLFSFLYKTLFGSEPSSSRPSTSTLSRTNYNVTRNNPRMAFVESNREQLRREEVLRGQEARDQERRRREEALREQEAAREQQLRAEALRERQAIDLKGRRREEVLRGQEARDQERRRREEALREQEARQQQVRAEALRERQAIDLKRRRREEALREQEARDQERRSNEEDLDRALQSLIDKINLYIRTRNRFDSSDPLCYSCGINGLMDSQDVMPTLELYNIRRRKLQLSVQTLREFVASCHHFEYDLDSHTISVKYLTPFQGANTHRVFGYFKCSGSTGCGRTWRSASSWKNKWQKCQECERKCYPYDQHVLEKREDDSHQSLLPHQQERCERCIELGRLCVPERYYSVW